MKIEKNTRVIAENNWHVFVLHCVELNLSEQFDVKSMLNQADIEIVTKYKHVPYL